MDVIVRTKVDPEVAMRNFKPGVHKHYKGPIYSGIMLVQHHDSQEYYVVYVSHTTGKAAVRPLASATEDSWTDMIGMPGKPARPAFEYVCFAFPLSPAAQ